MTRPLNTPYRTRDLAARDRAATAKAIDMLDGTDWPPTPEARAERVAARQNTFATMRAYHDAYRAFDATPSAANLSAYLDARDALRRITKEIER